MMFSIDTSREGHNAGGGDGFHLTPQGPVDPGVTAHRTRHEADWAERRALLRESDRARFWFAVRTTALCWVCSLVGLIPMAWALHTTDERAGRVAWAAGPVIGAALILTVLLRAAIRWEQDDW